MSARTAGWRHKEKEVRRLTLDSKARRKQLAEAEQQLTEAKQAASQLAMHQFDSDDE